ncbi:hypothetical protein GCM10022243_20900 [Saccharothrix violaceirubra]
MVAVVALIAYGKVQVDLGRDADGDRRGNDGEHTLKPTATGGVLASTRPSDPHATTPDSATIVQQSDKNRPGHREGDRAGSGECEVRRAARTR